MTSVASLVFSIFILVSSLHSVDIDLGGVYDVTGTNPNKTRYKGHVNVTRVKDTYHFHWHVGSEFRGQGKLTGSLLKITWGKNQVVYYTLKNDGILEGTWADGRGFETLTPR